MSFFEAKPAPTSARYQPGPIVSAVLHKHRAGFKVRVNLNKQAQEKYFNTSLIGRRLTVQIGKDEDQGKICVRCDPKGAFEAKPFLKAGGVSIAIDGWDDLPDTPRGKADCKFLTCRASGAVVFALPPWSRSDAPGGKLGKSAPPPTTTFANAGKAKAKAVQGKR